LCLEKNTGSVVPKKVLQHSVSLMPLNVPVNGPPILWGICFLFSVLLFSPPEYTVLMQDLFYLVHKTSHEAKLHQARCLSLMECRIYAYENCFILNVVILTELISALVAGCELILGTVVSIPIIRGPK
jgi:hypothetical protein